jgi:hypothetical protein
VGGFVGGAATSAINAELGTTTPTTSHSGTVGDGGSLSLTATPKTTAQDWGAKVGDGVAAKVPDLVGFMATLPFQASLNLAEAKAQAALEAQKAAATQQKLRELNAKMVSVQQAAQAYLDQGAKLERSKNQLRIAINELAMVMDRTGGRQGTKFQSLAPFLGESEAYLAQSLATQAIGKSEQEQAAKAAGTRKGIITPDGADETRWWSYEKKPRLLGGEHEVLTKHNISLPVGKAKESAQGEGKDDQGANYQIDRELERLRKNDQWIAQVKARLSRELGI